MLIHGRDKIAQGQNRNFIALLFDEIGYPSQREYNSFYELDFDIVRHTKNGWADWKWQSKEKRTQERLDYLAMDSFRYQVRGLTLRYEREFCDNWNFKFHEAL